MISPRDVRRAMKHRYTVRQMRGRQHSLETVPADMLRYDVATVISQEPGQAVLESSRQPTTGRWESFGWGVMNAPETPDYCNAHPGHRLKNGECWLCETMPGVHRMYGAGGVGKSGPMLALIESLEEKSL